MSDTVDHYNRIAAQYFAQTVSIDMTDLHDRFIANLPRGGHILDAGCGSGRDAKAFLSRGFRVSAFDASAELCARASTFIGQPVETRSFLDVEEQCRYDGIWACASLLHLEEPQIRPALIKLLAALKPGGTLYVSFKLGDGERIDHGRLFTDATEVRLRGWLSFAEVPSTEVWISTDRRPGSSEHWLNALVRIDTAKSDKVVTGGSSNPFLPHLCDAISHADEIDVAVAFVKVTGLRLLIPDLEASLSARKEKLPARLRFLTSDYLDVTDPDALRLLMLLKQQGAQTKVFECRGGSFHMKAYLFARFPEGAVHGTAFIGSSNISRQALQSGLEWNYRIDYPVERGFLEARCRFEELFAHQQALELTDGWIDQYDLRRVPPPQAIEPGSEEKDPAPNPTPIQKDALVALANTRAEGYRRGLVVLATGLGKTWLAAFDTRQIGAGRVLFVAHREEILSQAADTFLKIRPSARVGFYMGQTREEHVDVLCASVQTLNRMEHLERFSPDHFDYIVIDEFHHASAATYRRLLRYFTPRFMLGLTATPDRTDRSDILSLCDDNLVHCCDLFAGISAKLLAPFHYYGIYDDSVDYESIPWRNGRFDPEQLSSKLATMQRAKHALREWTQKAQLRTLAFCISTRHADYMAEQFARAGVPAAAVYSGSAISRGDALDQLRDNRLKILFSVDLFNEGVDLPEIDTVLMLRPTESKILFLQQLGRGLRTSAVKEKLVVLDFIGNHHAFLHKPQALLGIESTYKALAAFGRDVEAHTLALPDGCYVNYDLKLIDYLKSLDADGPASQYLALKDVLGRRPTMTEYHRAGHSLQRIRRQHGSWLEFVATQNDLTPMELEASQSQRPFLKELEIASMTKSFKMVLLEAFQELDGWHEPPTISVLARRSWQVLQRRRALLGDLPDTLADSDEGQSQGWQQYWQANPVNAWVGGNLNDARGAFFRIEQSRFQAVFEVNGSHLDAFADLTQEIVDFRLAAYEARSDTPELRGGNVVPFPSTRSGRIEIPYFPNLKIACGHFKTGRTDSEEYRQLSESHGRLDPARHFIARASGNSMDGGKTPIKDGDYLLLEHISPSNAGSITGGTIVAERTDEGGDDQYLLRVVIKSGEQYVLRANNPDYADLVATDDMRTRAKLKEILNPLDLAIGQDFLREDIPPLFNETYNPGNWNSGHVVLRGAKAQVLLVTLNKQGKSADHRYVDHWIDDETFHWQSQNQTTPASQRGRDIIDHEARGTSIHLFVRERKLAEGKGAPFTYHGPVRYLRHSGSAPMSVQFGLSR